MTANELLIEALADSVAAGFIVPCGQLDERSLWLSDDPAERAEAATLCGACPAIAKCRAAAVEGHEQFGVWGGRDMGDRKNQTWRTPQASLAR